MKIGVAGVDPPDAVFPHNDDGMGIVNQIPRQGRPQFPEYLISNNRVTIRFHQNDQGSGWKQGLHEPPGLAQIPGMRQDSGMSADPQKFLDDLPGPVPGGSLAAPGFYQFAAASIFRGTAVGCVDQNIGIH